MRPDVVVVLSPGIDDYARIVDAGEPVEIKTVFAELAIEALSERVLGWLDWLSELQLDASPLCPEEHRIAGQFGAVIADDPVRQRATLGNPVKLVRQPQP